MQGHYHRQGANSWRLMVYVGRDPLTGKKRRKTKTVHGTESDAQRELRRLLTEVDNGLHRGPRTTVAELVDQWLAHRRKSLEVSTWQDYRRVADMYIVPAIGRSDITRVTAFDFDCIYDAHAELLGAARIRRIHTVLSGAFAQAVRWQWLATNPALSADPPPVRRAKVTPPSTEAVAKLCATVAETDLELLAYVYLDADVGARRGELCGLQWGDLDEQTSEITIARSISTPTGHFIVKPTKTDKIRTVAVSRQTMAVLVGHRRRARELALRWGYGFTDETPMFIRPKSGLHWRGDTAGHRFRAVCEAAGVHTTIHKLRHYVATKLIAGGVDVRTVAGRLGHDRTSTTVDMYSHFEPARDREAADLMGSLLPG